MEFLLASANRPFVIALALVVLLALLEVVSLLLGGAISLSHGHGDADMNLDMDSGAIGDFLQWLHVGNLPMLIVAILWLLAFGSAGIVIQLFVHNPSGVFLPGVLAAVLAFVAALPLVRLSGLALRPLIPRDDTEAVSSESFVGGSAQITVGTARKGRPAEARTRDKWGKTHYVMVEPEHEGEEFSTGSSIMLLKKQGEVFRVIDNPGVEWEK